MNKKRYRFRTLLAVLLLICLLSPALWAQGARYGYGDVTIHLNGGDDVAYIGETNTIEVWILNDESLIAMTIGFEFAIGRNYVFDPSYGAFGYVNPEGNAVGAFNLYHGETEGIDNVTPDSIMIGGVALSSSAGLPAQFDALCYTMQVDILPGQSELPNGFCVDNIYYPPAGTWTFADDGGYYAPEFQGNPNTSQSVPDAPPVCFDIVHRLPTLSFNQVDFNLDSTITDNSDWGAVDLTFEGSDVIQYFNLNINDTWQVQNIPVLSLRGAGIEQTQHFSFDLGNDVGDNVDSLNYAFELTPYTLPSMPAGSTLAAVGDDQVVIYNGGKDVILHSVPPPAIPLVGGEVADPVQHKHENFPNQEAGDYECAPTAVSNSMQFLNTKHNMGMNPDDLTIAKMKVATKWEADGCYIWGSNAWWKAKDAYMQANNLPVTTRMLGPNDIRQLAAEIDAGQDIEAELNGHTVAVVGIAALGNGKYSVTIAHDKQQDSTGGTTEETGVWDSTASSWSGDLAGYGLNYFVVECPRVPGLGEWYYHPRLVNGCLTVYGTIDCQTIDPPLFERDSVFWCHQYHGWLPPWYNDYLLIFEWDWWCGNVDYFKVAVPYFDFELWRLYPLAEWMAENLPVDGVVLPTIGDQWGEIQNVYIVVDLAEWLADPRPIQDEYDIINGECPDLPGYLIGTTPITFDSLAGPWMYPFETTPLNGILYCDADLTFMPGAPYICGDADATGVVEISDAVYLINYVFVPGSPAPMPYESGDVDCSGVVEISDAVYIINYIFVPDSPEPCDPDGDGEPDC